jgi:hypothetical protein
MNDLEQGLAVFALDGLNSSFELPSIDTEVDHLICTKLLEHAKLWVFSKIFAVSHLLKSSGLQCVLQLSELKAAHVYISNMFIFDV